jgi:hypothetical protein
MKTLRELHDLWHHRGTGQEIGHWKLGPFIDDAELGPRYEAEDLASPGAHGVLCMVGPPVGLGEEFAESDPGRRRFFETQRAAAATGDPGIVRVLEDGFVPVADYASLGYMVSEPVGPTVASLLARCPLGIDGALLVGTAVARTLRACHRAGIVHQRLEPRVVHVGALIKVGGFGTYALIGVYHAQYIKGRAIMPRPDWLYRAPEQYTDPGVVDPCSDIHALGVLVHECVTGQQAYPGEHKAAQVQACLRGPARDLPGSDPRTSALDRLLEQMTQPDPAFRPRSMEEVLLALEELRR